MAGDLFAKEGTIATLSSSQGTLSNGTAVALGTNLDVRSSGTSGAVQNFFFACSLLCQWATITSIAALMNAAELYMVPSLDGSTFPDVDTTGGASVIAPTFLSGFFTVAKAPTANTDMLFTTRAFRLQPWLYKPYLLNRSGQTIATSWTLKVMSARGQYT